MAETKPSHEVLPQQLGRGADPLADKRSTVIRTAVADQPAGPYRLAA